MECVERGLDPLTTNLVVADASRTDKTICLAVSPGLKSYGIPGRPRLFEVIQAVKVINSGRRYKIPQKAFTGKSYRTDVYKIYLKYIAPEDIHVYSCDEVFMDVTDYLGTYHMTVHELAVSMIRNVLSQTGITATAGIGTNMYLCKVAMDIVAKHIPADRDGVRIAELNERTYRERLWSHTPLTDFWRIGHGTEKRLFKYGLLTMGDIAEYSIRDEELLYKIFGVNAELLIDHAWGWEPCTIACIKQYKPESNSVSTGQVLQRPYKFEECEIIVREMAEYLTMDMVGKALVTDQIVLTIGYDSENFNDRHIRASYKGEIHYDHYGRPVPKHAHGTVNLNQQISSTRLITENTINLYRKIVNPALLIRRVTITANNMIPETNVAKPDGYGQLDLFTDYAQIEQEQKALENALGKERSLQRAVLKIRQKYGKNAVIRGMDLLEGAMTIERNGQIEGHKA